MRPNRMATYMLARFKQDARRGPILISPNPRFQCELDEEYCSYRNFVLPRHDGRIHGVAQLPDKFNVTALLRPFHESSRLKPAFDFTKRLRAKPRQARPRSDESLAVE